MMEPQSYPNSFKVSCSSFQMKWEIEIIILARYHITKQNLPKSLCNFLFDDFCLLKDRWEGMRCMQSELLICKFSWPPLCISLYSLAEKNV